MNYNGIDYGNGLTNVDKLTGIRYGVISQHSLNPETINDVIMEGADYGSATCPKCGNAAIDSSDNCETCATDTDEQIRHSLKDYHCHACATDDGERVTPYSFYSDSAFSEEMQGWEYEGDGYRLGDCLDSDVFVFLSPYYTYAQFCSPCVPGAGNLDSPIEPEGFQKGAPKIYCLGHEWFEDGKAPYRVFNVSDESEVTK